MFDLAEGGAMNRFHQHALFALALCSVITTAVAASGQAVVVNGIEVDYGIAPAAAMARAAVSNQSGTPGWKWFHAGSHHLVVSLSEVKTGQRISDATVVATVMPLGLAPTTKPLLPIQINNTITYGNFFDFSPSSGPYRISLNITRSSAGAQEPVVAEFEYRPSSWQSSGR
jgi:hypothetical protein